MSRGWGPRVGRALPEGVDVDYPRLTSKDWFIDAEMMIAASRMGLRIGEVEVDFLSRNHGASNVRLTISLEFLKNMLLHWIRPRRRRA